MLAPLPRKDENDNGSGQIGFIFQNFRSLPGLPRFYMRLEIRTGQVRTEPTGRLAMSEPLVPLSSFSSRVDTGKMELGSFTVLSSFIGNRVETGLTKLGRLIYGSVWSRSDLISQKSPGHLPHTGVLRYLP